MARVSSKSLFFSSSILESPLRTEGGTMPLYLSHPESFSCSHAPTRTETTSICVSIQGRSLQNCFTDRIFRKVKESRYLVNQWCNIDISTQTYICGFPPPGWERIKWNLGSTPRFSWCLQPVSIAFHSVWTPDRLRLSQYLRDLAQDWDPENVKSLTVLKLSTRKHKVWTFHSGNE